MSKVVVRLDPVIMQQTIYVYPKDKKKGSQQFTVKLEEVADFLVNLEERPTYISFLGYEPFVRKYIGLTKQAFSNSEKGFADINFLINK